LKQAGLAYFRPYELRHTCATLLIYEGRTVNEVARHLGHADPGFTARTYARVYEDAEDRRRIPMEQAISRARFRAVFGEENEAAPKKSRRLLKIPAKPEKPTRGFEPRTPSLRALISRRRRTRRVAQSRMNKRNRRRRGGGPRPETTKT